MVTMAYQRPLYPPPYFTVRYAATARGRIGAVASNRWPARRQNAGSSKRSAMICVFSLSWSLKRPRISLSIETSAVRPGFNAPISSESPTIRAALPVTIGTTCCRAVMQTGTVTGAATVMLRTQPQVSRMISSLEGSLELRLFRRDGRRLIPTEEGLQFFQYIEPLLFGLDGVRNVAEDIKYQRGRPLVIAAEPFLLHALLPEAIHALSQKWDLKYAVDICVRGLGLWMSRSNADLAVVALPFSQTDMDRLIFAEAEVVLVLPPGHALTARETIDIPDLRHERL